MAFHHVSILVFGIPLPAKRLARSVSMASFTFAFQVGEHVSLGKEYMASMTIRAFSFSKVRAKGPRSAFAFSLAIIGKAALLEDAAHFPNTFPSETSPFSLVVALLQEALYVGLLICEVL